MTKKLVSVLTPVYNGASFLDECIQSVRRQTYDHFEFVIVDNCSTDGSYDIAVEAAAGDPRITVRKSDDHVGPIQNWNRALGFISEQASYVKFVHADDWLFESCIERMVGLAEQNDRVGLVSAYRLEEDHVSLDRLPCDAPLIPGSDTFTMDGRSVARSILLEHASVLGSPTAVLLRASLIRQVDEFFLTEFLHADKEAALRMFQTSDFGFVRQVLTYTRRHNESVTSSVNFLDTRRQENLLLLRKYGKVFLSDAEYKLAWNRELGGYYRFLARKLGTRKGSRFWQSHRKSLDSAGAPFSRGRLYRAFLRRWLNPAQALKEMRSESSEGVRASVRRTHGLPDFDRKNSAPGD